MSDLPLRVLVVDDELLARKRLVRLLSGLPGVTVSGECERGEDALSRAASDVDVVLLDIEMPGLSGVDTLKRWPTPGPTVVFCTAHGEHALSAFDGGAVDYLLKPVDAARLSLALERARARRPRAAAARLAIETANGVVLLDPSEISHLDLDGELTVLHTNRGRYFSAQPLSELQSRLPGGPFLRVHRRAILNLEHVQRFDPVPTGGLAARMRDGSVVAISRQAARSIRRGWRRAP